MADTELNLEAERAAYLAAFPDVHFSGAWTARNEQDFAVWIASANRAATKAAAPADAPKDHEIREAINQLRDVAVQYHATQQLRERIADIVLPLVKPLVRCRAPAEDAREEELPAELFDGHAVYSEITRRFGPGHGHDPDTVSATLDALARLIRARRASSVPAVPGTGREKAVEWYPIATMPVSKFVLCAGEMDGPGDWRMKMGHKSEAGKIMLLGGSWKPTLWTHLPAAPSHPSEAQTCTCPSGDGSLRWPCPVHPSEAKAREPNHE